MTSFRALRPFLLLESVWVPADCVVSLLFSDFGFKVAIFVGALGCLLWLRVEAPAAPLVLIFVYMVFAVFMWGVFMLFVLVFKFSVWLCSSRPVFSFHLSLSFSSEIKPLPGDPTPSPSSKPPGYLFSVNVC